MILVAAPFVTLALTMGPADPTALMLFALTFIAALVAVALGILVSTVGIDPEASPPRMIFDFLDPERLLTLPIAILFLVLTAISIWRLGFRPKPKILNEP